MQARFEKEDVDTIRTALKILAGSRKLGADREEIVGLVAAIQHNSDVARSDRETAIMKQALAGWIDLCATSGDASNLQIPDLQRLLGKL